MPTLHSTHPSPPTPPLFPYTTLFRSAYVMENLGIEPQVMRRRVEDALDLLAIADLRGRALGTLSSGEAQRVAIASVLTADRKSTRLNSSHVAISYAVFCLKKKNIHIN